MKKMLAIIISAILAITILGCSKNNEKSDNKTATNSTNIKSNNGDKKFPTDKYQLIQSYKQMMFIGMGLEQSIDYEYAVSMLSKQYQNESDAFKKKEIYDHLKPSIDSEINTTKSNKYYKIELPAKYLLQQPYDFNTRSFKMQNVEVINGYYLFKDINKYSQFSFGVSGNTSIPVSDELKARIIEDKRLKNDELKVIAYIYINNIITAGGKDDRGLPTSSRPVFNTELMHIKIMDKNDVLLAEI